MTLCNLATSAAARLATRAAFLTVRPTPARTMATAVITARSSVLAASASSSSTVSSSTWTVSSRAAIALPASAQAAGMLSNRASATHVRCYARGRDKPEKGKGNKNKDDDEEDAEMDEDSPKGDAKPAMPQLDEVRTRLSTTAKFLTTALAKLRTGRATPAMLDSVKVRGRPLNEHGMVSVKDASTLVISVNDETVLDDIERAIREADLNINPVRDGKFVKCVIPKMTQEFREKLTKMAREQGEEYKIRLRRVRAKAITDAKKSGVSTSEVFRFEKDVGKAFDDQSKQIDTTVSAKIKEIASS
ncbi:hypothetical protein CAOG_07719 [Capsaspora owczarzaki ATCC 30864]|uniref:Ribosome recycling factor domain-containing protein n=1 Tax=Capsaspora owczarzaki (strain ATCC 30864) TaxID=595528 RepID=A0A0D2WWD5_CAPO3|nr:hypothetical protein CAOG_07719 [Capsaspora owczarzaki ATCC 30864]KJE97285.1 hypothetical protein CAOG_007719 [Capsaspora owczarzaki ATCC 30864]|eukprot:XP_004343593.2 hypothetical protein CAOG_07719 [Capsaspora owczarzaki ATCC 30864]